MVYKQINRTYFKIIIIELQLVISRTRVDISSQINFKNCAGDLLTFGV